MSKRPLKQYVKSVFKATAPPCEKYECEHYSQCKTDKLACMTFIKWTSNGEMVNPEAETPNHMLYLKLYDNDKYKELSKPIN